MLGLKENILTKIIGFFVRCRGILKLKCCIFPIVYLYISCVKDRGILCAALPGRSTSRLSAVTATDLRPDKRGIYRKKPPSSSAHIALLHKDFSAKLKSCFMFMDRWIYTYTVKVAPRRMPAEIELR